MALTKETPLFDLDRLVESHLNLQVKISYQVHHDFLLRHHLSDCARVLDIGTGNGAFAARLARDHAQIKWIGIDKRKACIDRCEKLLDQNFEVAQVDLFSRIQSFDYSQFDGFLMRYFLLHVDHSKKILELLKHKSKRPARFWIIDLDFSRFSCEPKSEIFGRFTRFIQNFCTKTSVDSFAGQRVVPMLEELGFQKIQSEWIPFSTETIPLEEFSLYLKQEVICYSVMSGKSPGDPEAAELIRFIDEEVKTGKSQVSYGMVLVTAEL